ncbi:hypothetical protein ASF35_06725 [Aeromicrobium sp. Leaf291]|nr:hypothetical protein ASF35_06725 [Aeromicrobium sp. Leaf291]
MAPQRLAVGTAATGATAAATGRGAGAAWAGAIHVMVEATTATASAAVLETARRCFMHGSDRWCRPSAHDRACGGRRVVQGT